ncbi:uncharacterized protein [Montipora capricornis]|uniref:uncharacterized protein n=1 Tax=Montipora capricornis TaxID=246305 RepID=UPI0035F14CB5
MPFFTAFTFASNQEYSSLTVTKSTCKHASQSQKIEKPLLCLVHAAERGCSVMCSGCCLSSVDLNIHRMALNKFCSRRFSKLNLKVGNIDGNPSIINKALWKDIVH